MRGVGNPSIVREGSPWSGVERFTSEREDPEETDGRRMCEVLVGLGEVDLVGVEELAGNRLGVVVRSRGPRPVCGVWWQGVVQR